MSDRINLTELWRKYIQRAHEGNGTGCRCCDLVDDNVLDALVEAVEAALDLPLERLRGREAVRLHHALVPFRMSLPYTPEDHASDQAARRYENHLEQNKDHGP